jgi:hypothetical protein
MTVLDERLPTLTLPATPTVEMQGLFFLASEDGLFEPTGGEDIIADLIETPLIGGDYPTISKPATAGLSFAVGDWLVANATGWAKIANTDAVVSVNGRTGQITITLAELGGVASDDHRLNLIPEPVPYGYGLYYGTQMALRGKVIQHAPLLGWHRLPEGDSSTINYMQISYVNLLNYSAEFKDNAYVFIEDGEGELIWLEDFISLLPDNGTVTFNFAGYVITNGTFAPEYSYDGTGDGNKRREYSMLRAGDTMFVSVSEILEYRNN